MKLGSVDIGSNAIRLLISRVMPVGEEVQFKKVEFIRIPLRLGDDAFNEGKIGKEKQELFMMTMNAFKLIMDIHKVKYYRACATSAMREAKNGDGLIKKVQKKFDLKVEIISGDHESDLILKSLTTYFPKKGSYLNIDVGGGSTEMTLIKDHVPIISKSFPIGSVRLKEDLVSQKAWAEMEAWVRTNTEQLKGVTAIGTGGNINKLYHMAVENEHQPMHIDALEQLYEKISPLSVPDRIYKLKLNPDRADVIDYAAKIYLSIMRWAGIEKLYAPNVGLKDGIILDLWEKYKDIPR